MSSRSRKTANYVRKKATASNKDKTTKTLIELALNDNLNGIIGYVLEHRTEFERVIKDEVQTAFSDWTLPKVLQFFGIEFIPTSLADVKAKFPALIVGEIEAGLDTVYQLHGPIRECNEKAREKFIDVFLHSILGPLRCYKITDEGLVGYGGVEYVFTAFGNVITLVLEVKKDDIVKGMAQLAIELYAGHRMNFARGIRHSKILGILSTATHWHVMQYHCGGDEVLSTTSGLVMIEKTELDGSVKYEKVGMIADMIYGVILASWNTGATAFFNRADQVCKEAEASEDIIDVNPTTRNITIKNVDLHAIRDEIKGAIDTVKGLITEAEAAQDDGEAMRVYQALPAPMLEVKNLAIKWNRALAKATGLAMCPGCVTKSDYD